MILKLAIAAVMALAVALGVQTCRMSGLQDDLADEQRDRQTAEANSTACSLTLHRVNETAEQEIAAAQKQADAGRLAAARAQVAAGEAQAAQVAAARALAESKREPGCLAQLEVQLCAAIPLL